MISLLWSALKMDTRKTDDEYYQVIQYFDEGKVTEYNLNLGTRKLTYVLKGEKDKRTYTVPNCDLFVADIHNQVREYNQAHEKNPIKMNYESGSSNYWISQLLPMAGMLLLMGLMLYWLVKKMGNTVLDDTKRSMAFGKARLKTGEEARKTTFDDVAGLDEEKEDLQEIVEFLKNPQKFNDLGARIPKGVLLVGPPGTGKTLLARAVAGEADANFLSISGSDFVEMYVGVGASRVRDLFDSAKKNLPAIVFIDEIDAVGRQRGAGMGGGHDEREQTLNQLLVEMDGFGENAGVIIMAATNRPDILDPALLRPGRFDRQVTVNYPDVVGREAILKVHARNKPIGPDVRLDEIARATSGFTGADLENLLNEAALLAARRGKMALTKSEIEEATIKVVVGTEKKSKKITDDEKKLTAYHEAGHAITNYYLATLDPVHQVSIIPRGMAGGFTMSLPKDDKSYVSKKQMLDELVSLLGGRVAEAIILGDISTGASNDIERATKIARNMIIKYGMSDKLGPISYGSGNEEVFIGRDYGHVKNYSEETASLIDKEVEDLIMQAYERATEILRLHIDQLHELAQYLIKNEKIDGVTFVKLMEGKLDAPEEPTLPEEPDEPTPPEEPTLPEEPDEPTLPEEPILPIAPEEVPTEETESEPLAAPTEIKDFVSEGGLIDPPEEEDVVLSDAELAFKAQFERDLAAAAMFGELFNAEEPSLDTTVSVPEGGITSEEPIVEEAVEEKVEEPIVEATETDLEELKKAILQEEEPKTFELPSLSEPVLPEESLEETETSFEPLFEATEEVKEEKIEDKYASVELESSNDADINDYLTEEDIAEVEAKAPKAKVKPTKAKSAKAKVKTKVKKAEPKVEPKVEDEIPEGKVDFYDGEEEEKQGGTFTENDEIYALYELLKTARDFDEEDDK
ncbi:MAG: ATP-dependent zinc metalloprotease FtsH [Oscillospiraceae bacterium]|nr:ATP-dependent zinc metalloprotease FtsH [Candidatus Limimonas coprohippi]